MKPWIRTFLVVITASLMGACSTFQNTKSLDYTAYRASNPRSILVLPPVSRSIDVNAGLSILSLTTFPLAEAGYYVLPVAWTYETFKLNGITVAEDAQNIPTAKLYEIFGADAALYITVTDYGSKYKVINSVTHVAANAKLVDLRSGALLWSGSAEASSDEQDNNNQSGILFALANALIKQVVSKTTDRSHQIANIATLRLLHTGTPNGLLYGPYNPSHNAQ